MVKPKIVTGMVTLCRHMGYVVTLHSGCSLGLRLAPNSCTQQIKYNFECNFLHSLLVIICTFIYLEDVI